MTSSTTTATLRILSHNLLFVPEWRHGLGQSKRARLMARADYLSGHDVVFLQEAWDPNATNILKEALQEQYPFQTPVAGHSYGKWNVTSGSLSRFAAANAGVFIASKWPIVFQQQHVFENASGSERWLYLSFSFKINMDTVKGFSANLILLLALGLRTGGLCMPRSTITIQSTST